MKASARVSHVCDMRDMPRLTGRQYVHDLLGERGILFCNRGQLTDGPVIASDLVVMFFRCDLIRGVEHLLRGRALMESLLEPRVRADDVRHAGPDVVQARKALRSLC